MGPCRPLARPARSGIAPGNNDPASRRFLQFSDLLDVLFDLVAVSGLKRQLEQFEPHIEVVGILFRQSRPQAVGPLKILLAEESCWPTHSTSLRRSSLENGSRFWLRSFKSLTT